MSKELAKVQMKYKSEVSSVEKENDSLKHQLDEIKDSAKLNFQRLRDLEIDNEGYER